MSTRPSAAPPAVGAPGAKTAAPKEAVTGPRWHRGLGLLDSGTVRRLFPSWESHPACGVSLWQPEGTGRAPRAPTETHCVTGKSLSSWGAHAHAAETGTGVWGWSGVFTGRRLCSTCARCPSLLWGHIHVKDEGTLEQSGDSTELWWRRMHVATPCPPQGALWGVASKYRLEGGGDWQVGIGRSVSQAGGPVWVRGPGV